MCLPFCLGRPAWERVRRSCGYRVNVFTILASSLLMIRKFYSGLSTPQQMVGNAQEIGT